LNLPFFSPLFFLLFFEHNFFTWYFFTGPCPGKKRSSEAAKQLQTQQSSPGKKE
jgi:hypothetical protein